MYTCIPAAAMMAPITHITLPIVSTIRAQGSPDDAYNDRPTLPLNLRMVPGVAKMLHARVVHDSCRSRDHAHPAPTMQLKIMNVADMRPIWRSPELASFSNSPLTGSIAP
jgi:hypothetical protein